MIISFLNQKGGVGKTTLAINLAHALQIREGSVLLIDADSQESTLRWHEANEGAILPVIGIHHAAIANDLLRFQRDYQYVFVDGPAGINNMTLSAMVNSDIVLIPIGPSQYDIWSSQILVDKIETEQLLHDKPRAAFIITQKRANTKLSAEVHEVMRTGKFPIFESSTFHREIYKTTVPSGKTVFDGTGRDFKKGAQEINDILTELLEFIK